MLFIYNYMSAGRVSVNYDENTKLLSIMPYYYPGHRIIFAHEKGSTDFLTSDELTVYNNALSIVEQAKNKTDSELSLEIWLHDWIAAIPFTTLPI